MRRSAYLKRLTSDLDRWIARGWVDADRRDAILEDASAQAGLDTARWFGIAAALLAGLALIALIADNWGAIPRLVKLFGLLGLFLGLSVATLRTVDRPDRPALRNALAAMATLAFAAMLGLVGQSFNLGGDPSGILILGGVLGLAFGVLAPAPAAFAIGLALLTGWYGDSVPISASLGWRDGLAVLFLAGAIAFGALARVRLLGVVGWLASGPLLLILLTKATDPSSGIAGEEWAAGLAAAIWLVVFVGSDWLERRLSRWVPGIVTLSALHVLVALMLWMEAMQLPPAAYGLFILLGFWFARAGLARTERGLLILGVLAILGGVWAVLISLDLSLMMASLLLAMAAGVAAIIALVHRRARASGAA